jgi:hypothetical protein
MKFDPQKSFGYPVLRPLSQDYIGRAFEPELRLKRAADGSALELHYDLHCSSDYLNSLVNTGKAAFVVRVTCPQTFYEGMHVSKIKRDVLVIPKEDIRHLISLGAYIVAIDSIKDFTSDEFNPEFEDAEFQIEEGDVLACIDEREYYIEREVFENISSIFLWADRDDLPDGIWRISYEGEKVAILSNSNQRKVLDISSQRSIHQPVILNAIILPAIILLLEALIQDYDTHNAKRWARVLIGRMQNENLGEINESTDTLYVAQQLCDLPLLSLNNVFSVEAS